MFLISSSRACFKSGCIENKATKCALTWSLSEICTYNTIGYLPTFSITPRFNTNSTIQHKLHNKQRKLCVGTHQNVPLVSHYVQPVRARNVSIAFYLTISRHSVFGSRFPGNEGFYRSMVFYRNQGNVELLVQDTTGFGRFKLIRMFVNFKISIVVLCVILHAKAAKQICVKLGKVIVYEQVFAIHSRLFAITQYSVFHCPIGPISLIAASRLSHSQLYHHQQKDLIFRRETRAKARRFWLIISPLPYEYSSPDSQSPIKIKFLKFPEIIRP